jgi:hypothetical protein
MHRQALLLSLQYARQGGIVLEVLAQIRRWQSLGGVWLKRMNEVFVLIVAHANLKFGMLPGQSAHPPMRCAVPCCRWYDYSGR